jgi:hypothetical protein
LISEALETMEVLWEEGARLINECAYRLGFRFHYCQAECQLLDNNACRGELTPTPSGEVASSANGVFAKFASLLPAA